MAYTEREKKIRGSIQERKPECWEKIENIPNQLKAGKSIALMQFQRSYICNQSCIHCAISEFRKNIKKEDYMAIPEIRTLANQAHEYGLSSICISGGEPLIFPDLEEVIDAFQPERFVMSLDTNGLALTEEKIKWLVEKGVDRIHLSLDGLSENHDGFRHSEGSWQHNIDMLPICKEEGLNVIINIVATKDLVRSKQIEEQLQFVQQFGFHSSLIFAKPVGSFEEAKDQVLNSEDFEYLESLTKEYNCSTHLTPAYGRDIGCLCFKRHFSILPNGDCAPCPWLPISMGNVKEEGLETILERGLRNPWFSMKNKFTCHSGNVDSFFYQNITSQIEELSDILGEYPVPYQYINWYYECFGEDGKRLK